MHLKLYNMGNTCYLNTAFQCLFSTTAFQQCVETHGRDDNEERALIRSLHAYTEKCKTITDTNLIRSWKPVLETLKAKVGSRIDVFEQNDLCEFVLMLLDIMDTELQAPLTSLQRKSMKEELHMPFARANSRYALSKTLGKVCVDEWISMHAKRYSDVVPSFNSMLVSQIKCGGCGKFHNNYESHSCLQLDIMDHDGIQESMQAYIRSMHFNAEEEGDSKIEWTCDGCRERHPSKKVLTFWRLGDVLLIFLKRFNYNENGRVVKIDKPVTIQEVLNMDMYLFHNFHSSTYTLSAVGCHIGSAYNGHYFSLVKRDADWIAIDDDSERKVERFDKMAETHGYMFVYKK